MSCRTTQTERKEQQRQQQRKEQRQKQQPVRRGTSRDTLVTVCHTATNTDNRMYHSNPGNCRGVFVAVVQNPDSIVTAIATISLWFFLSSYLWLLRRAWPSSLLPRSETSISIACLSGHSMHVMIACHHRTRDVCEKERGKTTIISETLSSNFILRPIQLHSSKHSNEGSDQ